jgi:mannosyltransferase
MDDLLTRPGPRPPEVVAAPSGVGEGGRGGASAGRWERPVEQVKRASRRLSSWDHFDAVVLVLLGALALGLRWRSLWTSYWGDEAIAIGVAVHPVRSLPHYLANDGSPPLFYVMLHFWIRLFGRSEPATHALSMVAGLLAIPAAWWSGDRLFGRRAARWAAALVATCAYLAYYSTETRMYSWLVLTALLTVTCFILAYRGGGRRYWVAAALLMVAVLYLQYYGLYLLAATVTAGSVVAVSARSWQRLRATLLFGLACAAAFIPWAPQFLYQLDNTGAPWAPRPSVLDFFGDSFNALASAAWAAVVVAIAVAVLFRRNTDTRAIRREAWTGAGPSALRRNSLTGSPLALAAGVSFITLLLAWCVAQFVNSWNPRYLGIAVVPALVPLAGALVRARWGALALWTVVAAMACTALPVVVDRSVTDQTSKSDAAYLLDHLRPELRPGALVISTEVTDAPVLAVDLGAGFRYATPFGLMKDPLVVNWSDISTRLRGTDAANNLGPLLAALPVGGQVLVVNPTTWGGGETPENYAGPVEAEAIAANQTVLNDPQLQPQVTELVPKNSDPLYPMEASLFVKTSSDS